MEKLLKKLVEAPGISGSEENIRELMKKELKPYVDEIRVDKIGNLIAKKGSGSPKVMLVAHMDEIGLMVKHIDKNGFIKFETIGGWDERILLAKKVKIYGSKGPIVGVIGSKPIHIQEEEERKKPVKVKEMFIDIGAKNKKEVEKAGISPGDFITHYGEFNKLIGTRVTGYGFDDRIGCLELIEIMKGIKKIKGTIYAVGSTQEEIGLIGVRGSAFGINPDVILAMDTTIAGDMPGVNSGEVLPVLGKGPVLGIKDAISIVHPKIKKWIKETAKKNKIPLQYDIMKGGATDASITPTIREGIPSGAILTPTRYVHTPVEVLDLKDVKNVVKLVIEALKTVNKYI